jgi:hypothetical protein
MEFYIEDLSFESMGVDLDGFTQIHFREFSIPPLMYKEVMQIQLAIRAKLYYSQFGYKEGMETFDEVLCNHREAKPLLFPPGTVFTDNHPNDQPITLKYRKSPRTHSKLVRLIQRLDTKRAKLDARIEACMEDEDLYDKECELIDKRDLLAEEYESKGELYGLF